MFFIGYTFNKCHFPRLQVLLATWCIIRSVDALLRSVQRVGDLPVDLVLFYLSLQIILFSSLKMPEVSEDTSLYNFEQSLGLFVFLDYARVSSFCGPRNSHTPFPTPEFKRVNLPISAPYSNVENTSALMIDFLVQCSIISSYYVKMFCFPPVSLTSAIDFLRTATLFRNQIDILVDYLALTQISIDDHRNSYTYRKYIQSAENLWNKFIIL